MRKELHLNWYQPATATELHSLQLWWTTNVIGLLTALIFKFKSLLNHDLYRRQIKSQIMTKRNRLISNIYARVFCLPYTVCNFMSHMVRCLRILYSKMRLKIPIFTGVLISIVGIILVSHYLMIFFCVRWYEWKRHRIQNVKWTVSSPTVCDFL